MSVSLSKRFSIQKDLFYRSSFIFLLIIIVFLVFSCKKCDYKYPEIKNVSDYNGKPKDSLIYYFPTFKFDDSNRTKHNLSKHWNILFSGILYKINDPILYNYYLGKDIYRFIEVGAFSKPKVFELCKNGSKVWLNVKVLNQNTITSNKRVLKNHVKFISPNELPYYKRSLNEIKEETIEKNRLDSIISIKEKLPFIAFQKTKELSIYEWDTFEKLLLKANYWEMSPYEGEHFRIDGFDWLIEAHLKHNYWFVDMSNPNCNLNIKFCQFRQCGDYLLKLSDLDKDKLY